MLKNKPLIAKCWVDTADTWPGQVCGTDKAREHCNGSFPSLPFKDPGREMTPSFPIRILQPTPTLSTEQPPPPPFSLSLSLVVRPRMLCRIRGQRGIRRSTSAPDALGEQFMGNPICTKSYVSLFFFFLLNHRGYMTPENAI